jgi:hypothetical protein
VDVQPRLGAPADARDPLQLGAPERSSAVCAVLARLPQVERVPRREIVLRWR